MSWESMLNHRCDIYHLRATADESLGYGLGAEEYGYDEIPDIAGVPCHFATNGSLTITQAEPQAVLSASIKLSLPIGTDVRKNDKIVDCADGIEYTAGIPRQVRNHHLIVQLFRTAEQEAL